MNLTHRSRLSAIPSAALALLVLLAGPMAAAASAADATPTSATAVPTLTSTTVDAGGSDNISGGGCVARASVQVQLDGVVLITTKSSDTGSYSARLIIPVSAKPGTHRITVVCAGTSGQASNDVPLTVTLPFTGAASGPLAAAGGACLLLGATFIATSRKRRATQLCER
jgi:LPXTG-motif cell wall-anchored protein